MLRIEPKQFTLFSASVYARIPENHILKRLEQTIDFSFINELLADGYCKDFGRPAKEPELLMRLLFLKHIYNLSDVQVIEQASLNIAWTWFLGLNLEDPLPHPSLLAKFRTQRLAEFDLDDIITEIIRQCVDKGLIQSDGICIDATHIEANTIKKVPERIMKHLAEKIFKGLKKDLGNIPPQVDTNIPDYKQIKDHKQAKQMMKEYLIKVIQQAGPFALENTQAAIDEAKEILADERFIIQKGLRSLVDKDARVGKKSKNESFYGYKAEYTMLAEERLITAVSVQSGEKMDGNNFTQLLERTVTANIKPQAIYADKAYFRPEILSQIEEMNADPVIPVSESAYKIKEDLFSYNKDSDEWYCCLGNRTVKRRHFTRKRDGKEYQYYEYTFDKELCIDCPHRAKCMGKSKGPARKLRVGINTHKLWEFSQVQKTPEFKEKYKKRSSIEWKNAELKRFLGLARAIGYGLKAVAMQAKLTVIAANLKRIAALVGERSSRFLFQICCKSYFMQFKPTSALEGVSLALFLGTLSVVSTACLCFQKRMPVFFRNDYLPARARS
jgi:transposase